MFVGIFVGVNQAMAIGDVRNGTSAQTAWSPNGGELFRIAYVEAGSNKILLCKLWQRPMHWDWSRAWEWRNGNKGNSSFYVADKAQFCDLTYCGSNYNKIAVAYENNKGLYLEPIRKVTYLFKKEENRNGKIYSIT